MKMHMSKPTSWTVGAGVINHCQDISIRLKGLGPDPVLQDIIDWKILGNNIQKIYHIHREKKKNMLGNNIEKRYPSFIFKDALVQHLTLNQIISWKCQHLEIHFQRCHHPVFNVFDDFDKGYKNA